MDRAGFDPRYSPEFQRGFNPAADERASASTEFPHRLIPDPPAPVPQPISRRVAPEAQTTDDQSGAAWVDDMFGPADTAASGHPAGEPVPAAVPASPWRNPYLIALTIVGVVLIAGGIGAFRWSVKQVFGGAAFETGATQAQMEETILAAQLAWGLSPLAVLAGVLTLLGVFFVVAWRWLPNRRSIDGVSHVSQSD